MVLLLCLQMWWLSSLRVLWKLILGCSIWMVFQRWLIILVMCLSVVGKFSCIPTFLFWQSSVYQIIGEGCITGWCFKYNLWQSCGYIRYGICESLDRQVMNSYICFVCVTRVIGSVPFQAVYGWIRYKGCSVLAWTFVLGCLRY